MGSCGTFSLPLQQMSKAFNSGDFEPLASHQPLICDGPKITSRCVVLSPAAGGLTSEQIDVMVRQRMLVRPFLHVMHIAGSILKVALYTFCCAGRKDSGMWVRTQSVPSPEHFLQGSPSTPVRAFSLGSRPVPEWQPARACVDLRGA